MPQTGEKLVVVNPPEWLDPPDPGLDKIDQMQHVLNQSFAGHSFVELVELKDDELIARMPYRQETANAQAIMHGGAYFTLGDSATGCLLWATRDEPGVVGVTSGSSIRYLRSIVDGYVYCSAKIFERVGNKVKMHCTFTNDDGQRVAKMKIEYTLIKRG